MHGRTWGLKGQTPVVERPGQRQSIELVWSHMKRTGVARTPLRKGETLREKVDAQLAALKRTPVLIRSFFSDPECSLYYRLVSKPYPPTGA